MKRSQQLALAMKAKADELERLYSKYRDASGDITALSAEDERQINAVIKEAESLKANYNAAVEIEKADEANRDFLKEWNTPVMGQFRFSGAPIEGPDPKKSRVPAYTSVASLKHIDVGTTRQENQELAYRFFKFFCAVCLPGNSEIQRNAVKFCEENGIPTIKALGESVNEQGGSLVPPEFDPMLIRLIERFGVFRQFTRISPMAAETKMQPRRTGGVTANWVGESKQIVASDPKFDNVQLVAKKLAALTVISSEISEDSAINIADELAFEIAHAFALAEDRAGFNGDATSAFGGITGVTTKLKGLDSTIANIAGLRVASGNVFSEFVLDDFSQTVALLPQYADTQGAGWFCHRGFYFGVMQKLELEQGGVTMNETAQGDRRPRPLFLGYPVNFTQVMPRVDGNSQIACLLGDLSLASVMGDRRARTLFTDPYSLSTFDQIQVRGTERVDIVVHDVGNASATPALREPGPIVGLISAAS
jgi:HK97 family phage major capsid protein